MQILVASTRPAKLDAVREAVRLIAPVASRFGAARIDGVDVGDAAPRMPMSEAEVLAGARQRVLALQRTDAGRAAALCVGLEGGLHCVNVDGCRVWTLRSWACISDGHGWHVGAGPSLALPAAVVADVEAGTELGDVVDRLAGEPVRGTRGAWGLLTRDLVGRGDAFRLAVIAALAPFYNPALYARQGPEAF